VVEVKELVFPLPGVEPGYVWEAIKNATVMSETALGGLEGVGYAPQ
jgi:hypothetical protein